jgi:penicillin amidase
VDLADPDGSGGFILPGGQSGFPGSPHHMDQLPRWARGELVPLPLERAAVEARTVTRLRLVPPG